MPEYTFNPDYAISPGAVLRDFLEERGMSQSDLALRTDLTEKTISQIINGVAPVSYETSSRLEMALGAPASFWNGVESKYREAILVKVEHSKLASMTDWLKTIPVRELIERGHVENTVDKGLLVRRVLKFFGVSSVEAWYEVWEKPQVQFRGSKSHVSHPGKVAAWIRIGELKAQKIECGEYNAAKFRECLIKIRSLTRLSGPEAFKRASAMCAEAGVALVLNREIAGASVSGATMWMSKNKCVIMLSLKYKTDDQFWFSFFHKAGHVLKHGKRLIFLDDGMCDDNDEEREANEFARETLIPSEHDRQLLRLKSKGDIRSFAAAIDVADGIVVGRLQHEGLLKHGLFRDLKVDYQWQ